MLFRSQYSAVTEIILRLKHFVKQQYRNVVRYVTKEFTETDFYDYLGRQIKFLSASDKEKSLDYTEKTEYNENGKPTKTFNSLGQYTQNVYDELGRLVTAYNYAGTPTTYTYDNLDRFLTQTSTIEDGVTSTIKCDYGENGISGTTYEYNLLGQQTKSTTNGKSVCYSYNAQGTRTAKVTSNRYTSYYLDAANVAAEDVNGELTSYIRGINLVASISGNETYYYTFNAHGDVVGLMSSANELTKSYDYDAFGVEKSPSDEDSNPFRYCGEYYDVETGTYYLRARYYDPRIGRFTQQDRVNYVKNKLPNGNEVIDPLSLNLYVYCANSPILYQDPEGNSFELTAAWTSSMWWLTAIDGLLPIGDIVYVGGIVISSAVDCINTVGIDNLSILYSEVASSAGETSARVTQWFNDTVSSAGNAPNPNDPNWNGGFNSFRALKKYLGSAGKGYQWHHIVEQCQIRRSGFDKQMIHNVNNIVKVSDAVHTKISAYYSSIDTNLCENMRVRDYISQFSFEEQYQFGIKMLEKFTAEYGGL